MLVVATSIGAFYLASGLSASIVQLAILAVGGFSITAASNIINQVLEKDFDALMDRTSDRPIVNNRLSASKAVLIAGVLCLVGVTLLGIFNPIASFFGMFAFILYAFIYTPLKRYSRVAVFIGAIAGAMPMLIGCVAFDGYVSAFALSLFMIQLAWQFPHFWSIAFLSFDDYNKAGFSFIPKNELGTIDTSVSLSSIIYAFGLIVINVAMYIMGIVGLLGFVGLLLLSAVYFGYSVMFYKRFDRLSARKLMFCSLLYVPMVLVVCIIDLMVY